MAASNEWTEWHLTPRGWVSGTEKTDFGRDEVTEPVDRVATYRYKEYFASIYSKPDKTVSQVWKSENHALYDELKIKFGNCPERL